MIPVLIGILQKLNDPGWAKPKHLLAAALAVLEALLGLCFIAVFVAKAVSHLGHGQ